MCRSYGLCLCILVALSDDVGLPSPLLQAPHRTMPHYRTCHRSKESRFPDGYPRMQDLSHRFISALRRPSPAGSRVKSKSW